MVVSYKNRFIKFFFVSLFLILLLILDFIWMSNSIKKGIEVSDSALIIAKWLNYSLVPLVILTEGFYIYSHYLLAKAKGYSAWLTLFGLVSTFGLLILFLLPDRRKSG